MPASLEQLRTVPTRSAVLQWYLAQLAGLGFNTAAWGKGTPQHTFLLGLSRVTTNFAEIGKQLVEMNYNNFARGAALEAYSLSRYGNKHKPATRAKHTVQLINRGTVAHTFGAGQLTLATDDNVQFKNLTGGTIKPSGGTLSIAVEAVKKGSGGNVDPDTIKLMVTPLAGVVATNPEGGQVATGEDIELDSALRLRNSTRWSRLTIELVRDSYINFALEAHPSIRRAEVDDTNPRGAGTLDVYIAGDSRPSNIEEITAAQNYMAKQAWYTQGYPADPSPAPANPAPTRVLVRGAAAVTINVSGTVYHSSGSSGANVQSRVEAAIRSYISLAPIGGYPYPSPGSVIPKNNLEAAILKVPGVRTVTLSEPAADVPLTGFDVAITGNLNLAFTAV